VFEKFLGKFLKMNMPLSMKRTPAFSMNRTAKACAMVLHKKFVLNNEHYAAATVTRIVRRMDRPGNAEESAGFSLRNKSAVTFPDVFLALSDFKQNLETNS
jgi:hypothetical protein